MFSNHTETTMFNLLKDREHQVQSWRRIYNTATDNLHFLQRLKLDKKLSVHDGCVNTICWNDNGTLILSGSDDQHLAITDPFSGRKIVKFRSGHRSNIFSAKFLPGSMDREVVSCSGSGEIFYTDVDREDTYGTNRFDCHFGTTYKLLVVPNEAATFLSCGDDGTVRFFDLRTKTSCSKFNCEEDVVVHLRNAVTAMAVDPVIPFHLAVASSDGIVRLYDRRMLKTRETGGCNDSLICRFMPPMTGGEKKHYRITSLNYRQGSHDILVNYSSENIYLFNTYETNKQQCYTTRPDLGGATSKPVCVTTPCQASIGGAGPSSASATGASASVDNGSDSESAFKPIKRLRLRGDWSDTGPDARPESEEPALTNTIMQRMSDLLTRMLNSHNERSSSHEGEEEEGATGGREDDLATSEDVRNEAAPATTTEAAAMLRSVMFRSANAAAVRSLGNHSRPTARFSISSEGLVSPELSSQDMEGQRETFVVEAENTVAEPETQAHSENPNFVTAGHLESTAEAVDTTNRQCPLSSMECDIIDQNKLSDETPRKTIAGECCTEQASVGNEFLSVNNRNSVINECSRTKIEQLDNNICTEDKQIDMEVDLVDIFHDHVSNMRVGNSCFTDQTHPVDRSLHIDNSKMNVVDVLHDQTCAPDLSETVINSSAHAETDSDLCGDERKIYINDDKSLTRDLPPNNGSSKMEVDRDRESSALLTSQVEKSNKQTEALMKISAPEAVVEGAELTLVGASVCSDPNSESNDSISDQMSTTLHIKTSGVKTNVLPHLMQESSSKQQPQPAEEHQYKIMETEDCNILQSSSMGHSEKQLCKQNISSMEPASSSSTFLSLSDTSSYFSTTTPGFEDTVNTCEQLQRHSKSSKFHVTPSCMPQSIPQPGSMTSVVVTSTASYCSESSSDTFINSSLSTVSTIKDKSHCSKHQLLSNVVHSDLRDNSKDTSVKSEISVKAAADKIAHSAFPQTSQENIKYSVLESSLENVNRNKDISNAADTPSHSAFCTPPSKPLFAFCKSKTIKQSNTSINIPTICTMCQGKFSTKQEDRDTPQMQDRVRLGLCLSCYKKQRKGSLYCKKPQNEPSVPCIVESITSDLAFGTSVKECVEKPGRNVPKVIDTKQHDDSDKTSLDRSNVSEDVQRKTDKGKGIGKSSLKSMAQKEKATSYAPYNSGKMRITFQNNQEHIDDTDVPSSSGAISGCESEGLTAHITGLSSNQPATSKEVSTSHQAEIQAFTPAMDVTPNKVSQDNNTKGSGRQRRVGYSLPPTGNFQLHDDDNSGEDYEDDNNERPRCNDRTKSERDRMSLAAQKIQEIYRKKREAKEKAKLMDVPQPRFLMKYLGHRNCRTMIKEANFYGDNFVVSGSDCGRILAWARETGQMVMYLDADKHVVNCVQPNLYAPVLASSGIDYDIKIWTPMEEDSQFDEEKAEMIIKRNELMLEETRDTVTVPAAFMLRILASLSQIRTGRNSGRGQSNNDLTGQD